MPINLEKALGVHAQALQLRGQRSQLLASNLANADTPGYKARDLDFAQALEQAAGQQRALQTTHARHLQPDNVREPGIGYRLPLHASLDGNTVEPEQEKAAFADNAVRYQASLLFLNRRLSGLRGALRDQT